MVTIIASLCVFSYFCGSIPFGLIISKFIANIDIRTVGSKNIGATNVVRNLGKKWGIVTFVLDGVKGIIPLYVAQRFFNIEQESLLGAIGLMAVIGHVFPIWLKFKGGKGVATTIVIFLFLDLYLGVVYVVAWYFFYKVFRIVSLASIISMISGLLFEVLMGDSYIFTSFIVALIIIYRHQENIKRILAGEEASLQQKSDVNNN